MRWAGFATFPAADQPGDQGVGTPIEGAVDLRLQDIRLSVEVVPSQPLTEPLPVDLAVAEVDADEPEGHGSGDCDRSSDG